MGLVACYMHSLSDFVEAIFTGESPYLRGSRPAMPSGLFQNGPVFQQAIASARMRVKGVHKGPKGLGVVEVGKVGDLVTNEITSTLEFTWLVPFFIGGGSR